jgi:hypothetical protein
MLTLQQPLAYRVEPPKTLVEWPSIKSGYVNLKADKPESQEKALGPF